jgi:O-methyltransferase
VPRCDQARAARVQTPGRHGTAGRNPLGAEPRRTELEEAAWTRRDDLAPDVGAAPRLAGSFDGRCGVLWSRSAEAALGGPMNERAAQLYLDLLKRCLTRELFLDEYPRTPARRRGRVAVRALNVIGLEPRRSSAPDDFRRRREGEDWPLYGETMVGLHRLGNIAEAIRTIIHEEVPGDFIETGVWRGGASIFARAALEAYGDQERKVWLADSFRGLPKPDPSYPADAGINLHRFNELAVSVDEVRTNFERYGLLDDRIVFLEGWFKDSLPAIDPKQRFSVARLDGDLYESTMQSLEHLYPKLSSGGFVLVDDYGDVPACAKAVDEFREANEIEAPLERVDRSGVFWRK